MKQNKVCFLIRVDYLSIDNDGLNISHEGEIKKLDVDSIVVCAGQESETVLATELEAAGIGRHLIVGARKAAEVDAKRAIFEAVVLADRL